MNLDELIKACQKQDSKAQEELYQLYKSTLFVLCLKYCANESEAEDNLHNAFIEIFTNIKKYKGQGSFEGWMKRITINKAIDSYKKSYQLSAISDKDYPDTEIEENELDEYSLDYILALVQNLPNQYRLVFCLYELDNYSHLEIAEMLHISTGTSKSNLHRAKIILKEQIQANKSIHNVTMKYGK
ncbi:MAG: sigma-70 family RNA polymerase sigma factor [Flavobacterium sp.]